VFGDSDGQRPVRKREQLPFRLGNLILRFTIVEDYPLGYPRVAAFMNSDENFLIYRRFGFLHPRILLRKQDELRTIEWSLDDLDHQDFLESEQTRKCLQPRAEDESRRDIDKQGTRKMLLEEAEKKVYEYGKFDLL
jgi:hypothetical protein